MSAADVDTGHATAPLSAREAAELAGTTESTFNRWVAAGLIPAGCIHPMTAHRTRGRRYLRRTLLEFLENGTEPEPLPSLGADRHPAPA